MRSARVFLLLALLAPSVALSDTTTGLVAHWPFSGNAQDVSGFDNHGSLVNGPTLTADRHGNPDSAFHFDGLATRIDIPGSPSLASPTTAITVAAWIRRDGWGMVGTLYNPILTKSTGSANSFQYRVITSQSGFSTAFNSWNTSGGVTFDFQENQWYHVASTWEADTLKSYINGQLLGAVYLPTTIVPDNNTLSIGSDVPGVLEIFYGDIDEVRIYDRALAPSDIIELVDYVSAVPITVGSGGGIHLGRAFPNPLSATAAIPFSLDSSGPVTLEIVDVAGRRIRTLAAGRTLSAGPHTFQWDGRDSAGRKAVAGLYLYRLSTDRGTASGKIIISR